MQASSINSQHLAALGAHSGSSLLEDFRSQINSLKANPLKVLNAEPAGQSSSLEKDISFDVGRY
ncbi:MAG TPA: hypothetical protein VFX23_11300 [Limnobacter sp.]|nr:hypothetical protein [Limnobacter sp.]